MSIKVLYFGVISDITGKQSGEFDEFSSVEELIAYLEDKYIDLKDFKYQISVNQKIVKESVKLSDNDEIALLPPFSGG